MLMLQRAGAFLSLRACIVNSHSLRLQASTQYLKEEALQVRAFKKRVAEFSLEEDSDKPEEASPFPDTDTFSAPFKVSKEEEMKLMIQADISPADNFFEVNLKMKKAKMALIEKEEFQKAADLEASFNNLMNYGFMTRVNKIVSDNHEKKASFLRSAGQQITQQFGLNKSPEEQLRDLKELRKKQRTGIMKLVPESMYKYIDYLTSLKKPPKSPKEVVKNVGIGLFFSFVVWANNRARSSFMFWVIGNLALISSLLTRNMPEVKTMFGFDKKRVVSWSPSAFKTAVAVCGLHGVVTAIAAAIATWLLPVSTEAKIKSIAISSLISTGYFTSFYEVFEKKEENGWRWKRAMDGILTSDEEAKAAQMSEKAKLGDMYDYHYTPDVDDYPPRPKYVDEIEKPEEMIQGGSAELDETDAKVHYDEWKESLKDSRRRAVTDVAPETPWVGSKKDMYVSNIPNWLNKAYKANVLKANSWRDVPNKFKKDFSEFEPFEGPLGFRDKSPRWIDLFSAGVWEEKVAVSRRAARAFGTYRKAMRNIDKEVVLLPCDE